MFAIGSAELAIIVLMLAGATVVPLAIEFAHPLLHLLVRALLGRVLAGLWRRLAGYTRDLLAEALRSEGS